MLIFRFGQVRYGAVDVVHRQIDARTGCDIKESGRTVFYTDLVNLRGNQNIECVAPIDAPTRLALAFAFAAMKFTVAS